MPNFVVERYRPSSDPDSLSLVADRLTAGARQVSVDGVSVRYVDTIFLPGDETCLHLFEADSEADVRAVARQAGIDIDRVVPAEQIEPSEDPGMALRRGPVDLRRMLATFASVVLLLATLGVTLVHADTPNQTYTGCLKLGLVFNVAIGSNPSAPCPKGVVQIRWDQTGPPGLAGLPGTPGTNGKDGAPGKSAYDIWLGLGNTGTPEDFVASLKGPAGAKGTNGTNGADGDDGASAYEVWLGLGNTGTEQARAAQAGSGIRYVRTTFVPGDQVVLHLFEAASSEALRDAVDLAQLDCDRMVEVLESAEHGVTTERGSR